MTDRELLELAAKAAGITLGSDSPWFTYSDKDGFEWWNEDARSTTRKWNPLGDDGDALRLAVKLHMFDSRWWMDFRLEETRLNPRRSDEEIVRRAIVRTAAAMQFSKEAQ